MDNDPVKAKEDESISLKQWAGVVFAYLLVPLVLFGISRDLGWWQAWVFSVLVLVVGVGGRAFKKLGQDFGALVGVWLTLSPRYRRRSGPLLWLDHYSLPAMGPHNSLCSHHAWLLTGRMGHLRKPLLFPAGPYPEGSGTSSLRYRSLSIYTPSRLLW